jgi:hypothetical protein
MRAAHRSTDEADRLLRTELRQALQGIPPEQLEHILHADDPLEAATPFLTAQQAARLEKQMQPAPSLPAGPAHTGAAPMVDRATLAAAAVALQAGTDLSAAGLSMPDPLATPVETHHGLPAQARPATHLATSTPS